MVLRKVGDEYIDGLICREQLYQLMEKRLWFLKEKMMAACFLKMALWKAGNDFGKEVMNLWSSGSNFSILPGYEDRPVVNL